MTLALPSCNEIINYPAPSIALLIPPSKNAGDPTFTLTVTGYKFTPSSQILWNGSPQFLPFFQSINEITGQVPAALIQNPGTVLISVFTPQPGGGVTTTLPFAINPRTTPVPSISSLSPTSVQAGSSGFTLLITGSNFVAESTVTINGVNRAPNVVNSSELEVQMSPSDVAVAGQVQIAVVNPEGPSTAPGGGSSTPVNLPVTNPVPILTSLTPANFAAGAVSNTAIGVAGTGFVPGSVIVIDGSPRVTAFDTNTQIQTQLTAGDLAVGGSHQVLVVNSGPGGGSSNILAFAVNPTLTAGLPVLIDVGYLGAEANQGVCGQHCAVGPPTLTTAGPSISSTGAFVAFASTSTNFFLNQANAGSDIFIRTTCLGSSCTPLTSDVSVGPEKIASNGSSSEPSIDTNGSHIAFTSTATNLVTGIPFTQSNRQVYWLPVCLSTATTCSPGELVSLSADGITPANADSYNPSISPDGRYVAFVSLATNLVTGVTTLDGVTPQVFVRDTCTGIASSTCSPTTYLVSTPDGVTPGNAPSSEPSVANDAAYVSFTSSASNFGATAPNPHSAQEIFVRTTCLITTTCTGVTTLASTPDGVTPANNVSSESKIASAGRFIVFASTATNLVAGAGPVQQIYVFDTCLSALITCSPSATLVSTPDGTTPGNALSEYPSVSQGTTISSTSTVGEFVAFASKSSNLGANTASGVENIFIRKTCLGLETTVVTTCTTATVLASQPFGTTPPQANGDSLIPAISGDCHSVAFLSSANNLVPNDTNNFANVFLALTTF
jgi:trimeric autotransporter adhesin